MLKLGLSNKSGRFKHVTRNIDSKVETDHFKNWYNDGFLFSDSHLQTITGEERMMAIVKASMAGTVWKIVVKEGEQVTAGQDVVILESMKMEIPIAAETDGVVKQILANEGDFINVDDDLVEIE